MKTASRKDYLGSFLGALAAAFTGSPSSHDPFGPERFVQTKAPHANPAQAKKPRWPRDRRQKRLFKGHRP